MKWACRSCAASILTALEEECNGRRDASTQMDADALWTYLHSIRQRPSNLNEMAADLGISRATLCRRSRRLLDKPIQQAHEEVRLEYAAELLSDLSRPIATIAQDCGFDDQRYFATRFKRYYGLQRFNHAYAYQWDLVGMDHDLPFPKELLDSGPSRVWGAAPVRQPGWTPWFFMADTWSLSSFMCDVTLHMEAGATVHIPSGSLLLLAPGNQRRFWSIAQATTEPFILHRMTQ